jgi:putative addiction module killer protein
VQESVNRIYYTFLKEKIVVLLQAGDKKQQQKDIQLACSRLMELLGGT